MGCAAATAKRRRKQSVGGYKNLPPMRRPRYRKTTAAISDRREARAKDKRMQMMLRSSRRKRQG